MFFHRHKNGFTLIELVIVVAILGILSAIGIPMYQGYQESAKRTAIVTNHKNVISFMTASFANCNISPTIRLGEIIVSCEDLWAQPFITYFNSAGFSNPVYPTKAAVVINTAPEASLSGSIILDNQAGGIEITTNYPIDSDLKKFDNSSRLRYRIIFE